MAVNQRIITARISTGYGVELYYDEGVKFTVTSDTGPVSSSSISGSDLNYDKYTSSGGANGDGISYSKLQIDGLNGGTSYHSWFNIYWNKTDDYDASTVGIPDGINSLSETGVSINLDEDDCPRGFDLLTASTPSYIYLKAYAVNSADNPISTKVAAFDSSAEITLYLGYNTNAATLTAPGTPTITENYDGTYTARWSAATGSGGSGSVYYQWWDVTNGGYWSNWSTATQVTLRVPSYGYKYEFKVRATYDGASASSEGSVESWSSTVSKTFTAPTVTAPGAPTIVQNSDGTYTASWTAATGSYGTGNVYYQLWSLTDGLALSSRSLSTSVILPISTYGQALQYKVRATYGGASSTADGYAESFSSSTTYTFIQAELSAPGKPTVTNNGNDTFTVSWTAATASGGTGSIYYRVIIVKTDGSYNTTTDWQTGRTYTAAIPSSGTFSIAVEATYNNASSSTAGTLSMLSSTTQATLYTGSLTEPGAPVITQNNNGTFDISWAAATGTNNTGNVYYQVQNVTGNIYLTSRSTGTSATLSIPAYGTPITFRIRATYGNASSSSDGYFTTYSNNTTVTFHAPALTNPGAPTIVQNNNGTYTATWTAATGSYGVGSVYYQLWNDSTGTPIGNLTTALTGTYSIVSQAGYDIEKVFKVKATYNNASSSSDGTVVTYSIGSTVKTFSKPVLSTPTLTLASNSGTTAQLSWTAATLTNTTGTISYSILVGGTVLDTTTSRTYTISETVIAPLSPAVISVQANATGLANTDNGSTLTTTSNNVIFTYEASFTGASNLRINGTNTATLTWTAGSTSYGNLVYDIYLNNKLLVSDLTSTNYLVAENLIYNLSSISFYVQTHNITTGASTSTSPVSFTYSPIFVGASNLTSNNSGSEAVISWTAGSISYGTITYDVYVNGTLLGKNLTKTSYTVLESVLKNGTNPASIYVVTKASPQNLTAQTSNISFTYIPSEIKHTVGYRKGGRNHNCLVYVNVDGAWIKCAPYIYINGQWVICSTT